MCKQLTTARGYYAWAVSATTAYYDMCCFSPQRACVVAAVCREHDAKYAKISKLRFAARPQVATATMAKHLLSHCANEAWYGARLTSQLRPCCTSACRAGDAAGSESPGLAAVVLGVCLLHGQGAPGRGGQQHAIHASSSPHVHEELVLDVIMSRIGLSQVCKCEGNASV